MQRLRNYAIASVIALHKKSKQSAKGAKYKSRGQARSEAERVAPGERRRSDAALKESRKLIEVDVNTTRCDDIKSLLDFAHGELDKNQSAKLHIVYYGGKTYNNQIWNEKLKGYDQKYLLPKRGEAKARVSFWEPYLVDTRRIDRLRIEVIDGGYREKPVVEMWIVPPGAKPPVPTPALKERDIRFRKGKPKWRDMYAESC
jgi:hypothetical protein